MSHFPAGQPSSLIPGALQPSPLSFSQDPAVAGANQYFATYAASLNCAVTGDTLLFTTDTSRGYFMPLMVQAICQNVFYPSGVAISNPSISIGFEAGNSYINFVNQEGLTPAGSIVSGQWERGDPTSPSTNYDVYGISLTMSQYGRAAPPGTGIYARVNVAGSGSTEVRSIIVVGIYLG